MLFSHIKHDCQNNGRRWERMNSVPVTIINHWKEIARAGNRTSKPQFSSSTSKFLSCLKHLQTTNSLWLKWNLSLNEVKVYREKEKNNCWSAAFFPFSAICLNSRLFQTDRVCRRRFQIWWKWQVVLRKGRKHRGKRRNCSLRAISLFHTVFS